MRTWNIKGLNLRYQAGIIRSWTFFVSCYPKGFIEDIKILTDVQF